MALKERINEDLKTAMKARDKQRLSVLRMMLSEVKYAQAAVNAHQDLPEEEVVKVVSTYHKRLTKSLADFPPGERQDEIKAELDIVADYLPKKADAAQVAQVVAEVVNAASERSFGPLMKEVLTRLGGAADGKLVSQLLKDHLAKS